MKTSDRQDTSVSEATKSTTEEDHRIITEICQELPERPCCCGLARKATAHPRKKQPRRLQFDNGNVTVNHVLITTHLEEDVRSPDIPHFIFRLIESTYMTFTTRRARIEAEKAEQLALRSRRNKKFSMSVAGLATAASASFIGMAPANAAMDDVAAPAASSSSSSTASSSSAGSYTVQSGDTPASIASSQGASLDSLLSANGLGTSSVLYPGDVLQLSGDASSAESTSATESVDAGVGPNSGGTSTASTVSGSSTVQTASVSAPASTGNAAIDKAVEIVNSGASYKWGGNGPSVYDCSGLTQTAFAAAGVDVPRNSADQFSGASSHDSLSNVQEGDLIFWSNNGSASGIYHVAMYVGDGKIAQARNPESGITVDSLSTYTEYNPPMNTVARY